MPKRWFYLEHEQALGPFAESELRVRLRRGELDAGVRAWHEDASGWWPLGELLQASAPPAIDTRPHPVHRYLARLVDVGLFGLAAMSALSLLLYAIAPAWALRLSEGLATTPGRALDLLLTIALSGLVAAVPLGLSGSTPGKWLFGIQVLDEDGHPIGLARALRREAQVWVHGLGLGIPLLSLLTLGLSYRRLMHSGQTRWDASMGLSVRHRRLSLAQVLAALAGLLVVGLLFWIQRG